VAFDLLRDALSAIFGLSELKCSLIFNLELVPSCLINCDLEPLSLDLKLLEIINLASSHDHLCNSLPSCYLVPLDQHAHTL
ncbi:hypothetical protein Tco_0930622, partial [Tanacetum coccineum]